MSKWIVDNRGVSRSGTLDAVGENLEVACDGASSALLQVISSTTVAAKLVAEVRTSDDAPWLIAHVMPTNDVTPATPIVETAAFTGVPIFGWRVDLQGASSFRVRLSVLGSGACVIQSKLSEQGYP